MKIRVERHGVLEDVMYEGPFVAVTVSESKETLYVNVHNEALDDQPVEYGIHRSGTWDRVHLVEDASPAIQEVLKQKRDEQKRDEGRAFGHYR